MKVISKFWRKRGEAIKSGLWDGAWVSAGIVILAFMFTFMAYTVLGGGL